MSLSRQLARYGIVGLANTAVGYGLILLGLWLGMGDYQANALGFAVGLCFSFFANRTFTFDRRGNVTATEVARFMVCFALAYAANLGVIAAGRAAGLAENPLVHLAGTGLYSVCFFLLMRSVTFTSDKA